MSEGKRPNGSDSEDESKVKRRKKTKREVVPLRFDSCDVFIEDGLETDADLDYVSMLNIAMSRHKKEFKDLKYEILEKEEVIPGVFLQRCLASVWVLDATTGSKVRKLECMRKARKVRFVKKAAYNGLIQLMLGVQPDLSYEPNSEAKIKMKIKTRKKAANKQSNQMGGAARNVLEMLRARDKITKSAAFKTNVVGDETKGCGMIWVTSCTVFADGKPVTVTAETTKKKTSVLKAARKMVDKLLSVCDAEACEIIRKLMGYPNEYDGEDGEEGAWKQEDKDASDRDEEEEGRSDDGNGNSNSESDDDDVDIDVDVGGKYSANRTEFRITSRGIFDTEGDEFKLPKGYKILSATTNAQCGAFIAENVACGTKVGVYVESREIYRSLHNVEADSALDIEIGEGCDVMALAVKYTACLISRKHFSDDADAWPPKAVCELFVDTKAELCGYKIGTVERALGFTPDYRHRISDIEACGSIDAKDGIHAGLKDIVEHWTSKKLDVAQWRKKNASDLKMRMATAVQTAAAVLSVYHSVCNVRDAKIRNRLGACAMLGFDDLMNILTGRKDLFTPVSGA